MRIDNSQYKAFLFCPDYWRERYAIGIERDWSKTQWSGSHSFGKRAHLLLEQHFKQQLGITMEVPAPEFPDAEDEVQALVAAYKGFYPEEPWDVLDVERTFEVRLGSCCRHLETEHQDDGGMCLVTGCGCLEYKVPHSYSGKFDVVARNKSDGRITIIDHKTERRGSYDNSPEAWAARSQATYYLWAAEQIYHEKPCCLVVDVLTRQSPKGQTPPTFRRDSIVRDDNQIQQALRDLVWVADSIERLQTSYPANTPWPQNRNNCVDGRKHCEFEPLHLLGRSEELVQLKYKPTEKYLDL